jgi:hypothetical protein
VTPVVTVRSVLLAVVTAAATIVPAAPSMAAATHVVDADGAALAGDCDAQVSAAATITEALARADDGDTILVCPGVVVEPGQVVVRDDVTIASTYPTVRATVRAGRDTGTAGDDRGWWLIEAGAELTLRDLDLDGDSRRIHQGLRFRGHGSVTDVGLHDIAYEESGPSYSGFGIVAFGDGPVAVTRATFSEIGRVGALFFGVETSGSVLAESTYVGKGSGDHLDYGVEVGAGAEVSIRDTVVTRARGRAQNAVSAGLLLSTAFGGGVGATLTGNTLSNNANGIFLDDGSGRGFGPLDLERNAIDGNTVLGVATSGDVRADATCNWWGATDGPETHGGSANGVASGISVEPFLATGDLDGRCARTPALTADTDAVTVDEGSPATVRGTYTAGTSAPVEITASTGTLARTGNNHGRWTWTAAPDDGPADSATVAITADNGRVDRVDVTLTVDNVRPSARLDAPATAFTGRAFPVHLRQPDDPSLADREAGLLFAFDCGAGTGFGPYSDRSSIECEAERGGRRTIRGRIRDQDGGSREYTSVVEVSSPDGHGSPERSAVGTVSPGGSVSTGDGAATPSDPIITTVETPSGGDVAIEEGPPAGPRPLDHVLLVWGSRITAPTERARMPLTLEFRLDADLLPPAIPGTGLPNVVPARGGEVVLPCTSATAAAPDPCLASRRMDEDDLVLTVRSPTGGAFDIAEATVACPRVGVVRAPFDDVDGNVHRDAIDCAVAWGLASGQTSSGYHPSGSLSRGQVATLVANLLQRFGVVLPASPEDRFADDDTSVHEFAIGQVAAVGVMHGRTGTRFAPDDDLTRAQLATVLATTYETLRGEALPSGRDRFRDDDGSTHEASIDRVAAAGLTRGRDAERFGPALAVRRDQAASFLTALLNLAYRDLRA